MNTTFLNRNEFRTLYGERTYIIAKNIEKLYQKKVKVAEHIHFLKECKRFQVVPKGLQLKSTTSDPRNNQLIQNTSSKLRNNLLDYRYKQRRTLEIEIVTQNSILKQYLEGLQPKRQHENDLQWMNKHDKGPKRMTKVKHERKLKQLINEQHGSLNNKENDSQERDICDTSNVVNLSGINLSKKHLQALSKGLKFVPTPSSLNIVEVITNTEKSLFSAPVIVKRAAISEISEFATKWKKPTSNNITKEEKKLLNEIKSNKNIIVVMADKGGKTVVMNKNTYIEKIEEKLKDEDL